MDYFGRSARNRWFRCESSACRKFYWCIAGITLVVLGTIVVIRGAGNDAGLISRADEETSRRISPQKSERIAQEERNQILKDRESTTPPVTVVQAAASVPMKSIPSTGEEETEALKNRFPAPLPLVARRQGMGTSSVAPEGFTFPNPVVIHLEEQLKEAHRKIQIAHTPQPASAFVVASQPRPTSASDEVSALASSYKEVEDLKQQLKELQKKQ